MRRLKLFSFVSAFAIFAAVSIGQTASPTPDAEQEKAKKELEEKVVRILDQVVGDASFLRLPQNKAIVFAMAGDALWKFDEKKARDLFRSSAAEILAYNIDAEREKRETSDVMVEFFDFSDPRGQIMPLVAKNDAELALELLAQTRPASLAEAMLKASTSDKPEGMMMTGFNPEMQRVRQEIALEQQFALLAADENPDRAIKLIRDSLSRGVTFNALQLLQKLHKKDEKKAAELGGEVIKKLIETDLLKKNDELQVSLTFLQTMARDGAAAGDDQKAKSFRFTDAQVKDLANKLANTFLQPTNFATMSMVLSRALPNLEKIVPERTAALRQRLADSQKSMPAEFRNSIRTQKLWDPNSTAEDILAEIPKLTNEMEKSNAYQAAANKISQIEDETRARRLIDQLGDEKAKARALEQFESAKINRAAAAGKLEDARRMIGQLTNKRIQVQKLVALAQAFHRKGTEADIESAKGLMKTARSLINEAPEDEDELSSLMEVVKGYATIDPDAAFKLFEPITEQINEVVQASAVLSKYNKRDRTFRKGELVLRTTNSSVMGLMLFRFIAQIQMLGKADLDRMGSLADRFQRSDARTLVKLVAIQGALRDDKNADSVPPPSGGVFYSEY